MGRGNLTPVRETGGVPALPCFSAVRDELQSDIECENDRVGHLDILILVVIADGFVPEDEFFDRWVEFGIGSRFVRIDL